MLKQLIKIQNHDSYNRLDIISDNNDATTFSDNYDINSISFFLFYIINCLTIVLFTLSITTSHPYPNQCQNFCIEKEVSSLDATVYNNFVLI